MLFYLYNCYKIKMKLFLLTQENNYCSKNIKLIEGINNRHVKLFIKLTLTLYHKDLNTVKRTVVPKLHLFYKS